MAKYSSLAALFTAIANAIRAKTGDTATIVAEDFPTVISSISTGGTGDGTSSLADFLVTEIASNVTTVDSRFSVSTLTRVKFPLATKISGTARFTSCKALTSAEFHSPVAFDKATFRGCSNFKTLILRSETMATWAAQTLTSTAIAGEKGYIYVPSALVDSYKATTGWSTYASQFRALEDYTVDGTIMGELDLCKM
jgi:hypothetical protein